MQAVVETPVYLKHVKQYALTEALQETIKSEIAANPGCGDPISGAGGARKVRFASEQKGKSGSYRVIFFFPASDVPIFLLALYGKGDKANLSKAERNTLAAILPEIAPAYRESVKKAVAEQRS